MEPQATGRASHLPGRPGFARVWVGGLLLLAAVALASTGIEARSSWPYVTPLAVALASFVVLALKGVRIGSLARSARGASLPTAAALVGAVALVAALAGVPAIARSGYDSLTGRSYPLALADLEPLSGYGSTTALAAAARVIPAGDSFSVLYGDQYPVPLLFQFWLMPTRTFTWDYRAAAWVILYQQPLPAGLRYSRKVELAPGIVALEVTH